MTKEYPWGKGTNLVVRYDTVNDSDVTYTVPTGKVWHVHAIRAQISTTATVGNRVFLAKICNADADVILSLKVSSAITASQYGSLYWAPGVTDSTNVLPRIDGTQYSNCNAGVTGALPANLFLIAGQYIQVFDAGAIDAAADDLIINILYTEYDA